MEVHALPPLPPSSARTGMEVGYYAGCVRTWRRLQQRDPATVPQRAERGLAALEALLASFPLDNPQVRVVTSPTSHPRLTHASPTSHPQVRLLADDAREKDGRGQKLHSAAARAVCPTLCASCVCACVHVRVRPTFNNKF